MFFTDFFIKRPVFATILNLVILMMGFLAYSTLNLREYPEVSSPEFSVRVDYPNASASVIEREVSTTVEDALGGLEGLESTHSISKYGTSQVDLRFKPGTSLSKAQSGIRDRLAMSRGELPDDAKEPIVSQQNSDAEPFLYLSLTSDSASFAELTHMAHLYLKNPLKVLDGVSKVTVMGQPYSIAINLDYSKLLQHGIDASHVYAKLQEYNATLPGGRYQEKIPITIDLASDSKEDFEAIPVAQHGESVILLKDVADIQMSAATSDITRVNGKPGVVIGVTKTSDGNPLSISNQIRDYMDDFQRALPTGVTLRLDFDKTNFIRGSLSSIESAIIEAILLVVLIVFLFLRSFRAILVPLVAIPLSLIGVLSLMALFGLSINTITLLAMVLAVGLVVDDAIVVLENIHRHIEEGMKPMQAALQGGREIGFAIVAMTFTLASVYIPIGFIRDTIGQIFLEFALTLAGAVIISGIVALTFSPLLCSKLLKKNEKTVLPVIDRWLQALENMYKKALGVVLQWPKATLASVVACFALCTTLFTTLPQALTPTEDRGVVGVWVPALAGASLDEFDTYLKKIELGFKGIDESEIFLTFGGSWGSYIVTPLKLWDQRKRSAAEIVQSLQKHADTVPTIAAYAWSWDSGIPGVEQVSAKNSGLTLTVKTVGDYYVLNKHVDRLRNAVNEHSLIIDSHHDLKLNTPGYTAEVDRRKFALSGLRPDQLSLNLAIMMEENKNLSFRKDGIRYPVSLKSQSKLFFLEEVFAVNEEGRAVPFSSFMNLRLDALPKELNHHNQLRSAQLNVTLAPGTGLEKGVRTIDAIAQSVLPDDVSYEYSGAAGKLKESSNTMAMLILIAILFIYCILAIQFESFTDPLIILFTVPLAGLGALSLVWVLDGQLDIFTQVGLVTLIGLISKHGILIVEFANQQIENGKKPVDAVLEAARLRLRPILMTTGAMVFGALPLVLSSGAGAEARQAIGLVLVGGLTMGTLLTLFIIPGIYKMVKEAA